MEELNLDLLESGEMPGLSGKAGAFLLEACLVCLAHNGHSSGKTMQIDQDEQSTEFRLVWTELIDEQVRRTHADMQDATEWGASGVACILVCRLTGLVVTRRSRKGTGFDYWLGKETSTVAAQSLPFQDEARLEVTGMLNEEKESEIDRRLRGKTRQVKDGKRSDLPGFATVIEFGRPLAKVEHIEAIE